jgi:hypothetical protein
MEAALSWQVNNDGIPITLTVRDPYAWVCCWDGKRWRHRLRTDLPVVNAGPEPLRRHDPTHDEKDMTYE